MGSYSLGRAWAPAQTTKWRSQNGHVLLSSPSQRGRQETRRSHLTPATFMRAREASRGRLRGRRLQHGGERASGGFSDPEFMAPGSIPLWGAGGLEGEDTDCTGFPMHAPTPVLLVCQKPRIHTFKNAQLGLNERDESTHYPVFMHLLATHLPGGTRASLRSERSSSKKEPEGGNEKRSQTSTALGPGCGKPFGRCNQYRLSGTIATHTT